MQDSRNGRYADEVDMDRRRRLIIVGAVVAVVAAGGLWYWWDRKADEGGTVDGGGAVGRSGQWDVPIMKQSDYVAVWPATDGSRVFLSERYGTGGLDSPRKHHFRLFMLDTATGECTDIAKRLARAIGADESSFDPTVMPSPDGKHGLNPGTPYGFSCLVLNGGVWGKRGQATLW